MAADWPRLTPPRADRPRGESRVRRSLALVLGAALAASVGCDSPTADDQPPGYDPTVLTGGLFYRWPLGRTVSVFADTTAGPAGSDIRAAVAAGAAAWEGVVYYREFELRLVDDPRAADIIVHHRQAPRLVDVRDCEPPGIAGGKTVFCADAPVAPVLPLLDGGDGRVKVDIYVDYLSTDDAALAGAGLTRQEGFASLTAHELGHALGIGAHSTEPADLMAPVPTALGPTTRDAATLRYVLHRRPDIQL